MKSQLGPKGPSLVPIPGCEATARFGEVGLSSPEPAVGLYVPAFHLPSSTACCRGGQGRGRTTGLPLFRREIARGGMSLICRHAILSGLEWSPVAWLMAPI